jgi:hypothetical protein
LTTLNGGKAPIPSASVSTATAAACAFASPRTVWRDVLFEIRPQAGIAKIDGQGPAVSGMVLAQLNRSDSRPWAWERRHLLPECRDSID